LSVITTRVALLAVTVRSVDPPALTDIGLAVMVTVGAAPTVTVADAVAVPPDPVAVRV
jgi:hypothetical protein